MTARTVNCTALHCLHRRTDSLREISSQLRRCPRREQPRTGKSRTQPCALSLRWSARAAEAERVSSASAAFAVTGRPQCTHWHVGMTVEHSSRSGYSGCNFEISLSLVCGTGGRRQWDRAITWPGVSGIGRTTIGLAGPRSGESMNKQYNYPIRSAGRPQEQQVRMPLQDQCAALQDGVLCCKTVCHVARRWAALQHGALLRDPVMPLIPGQAMPHEHSANMRRIAPVGTRCGPSGCTSAAARWRRALSLWSASVRCRGASAAARRALSAQCVHEVEWPCAVPLQYPMRARGRVALCRTYRTPYMRAGGRVARLARSRARRRVGHGQVGLPAQG